MNYNLLSETDTIYINNMPLAYDGNIRVKQGRFPSNIWCVEQEELGHIWSSKLQSENFPKSFSGAIPLGNSGNLKMPSSKRKPLFPKTGQKEKQSSEIRPNQHFRWPNWCRTRRWIKRQFPFCPENGNCPENPFSNFPLNHHSWSFDSDFGCWKT